MLPKARAGWEMGGRGQGAGAGLVASSGQRAQRVSRWAEAPDEVGGGRQRPGSQARDQSRWNWWLIIEGANMCLGRLRG